MSTSSGTLLQSPYTFWYMRRGKGVAKQAQTSTETDEKDKDNKSSDSAATTTATPDASTPASASSPAPPTNPYESSIKQIATVKTVEEFWNVYDYLVRPNDLPTTTDYHFFRSGIKPTWEDPTNARGGKWIVRLKKGLASRYWEEVILALIGCQFTGIPTNEVCGAVVSIRYSEDIVSVWNRTNDREITERLRDGIKRVLQLPGFVHMEYKPHETSLQDKSSFRNTQVWKPKDRNRDHGHGHGHGHGHRDRDGDVPRRSSSWTDRDDLRGKKSNEGRWR